MRMLAMAGGVAGAVALSQFPAFSQQYLQRLAGAVDELRVVATAVDTSARAAGQSRDAALDQLRGTAFGNDLSDTLSGQLARHDRLSRDYAALRGAPPLERLAQVWRFSDPELVRRTWDDFRPAMPVSGDGLICAGIGYGAGWLAISALMALAARPLRRRRAR